MLRCLSPPLSNTVSCSQAHLPEEGAGSGPSAVQWRRVRLEGSKQVVTSHIAARNAATAQVVTLTAGEK